MVYRPDACPITMDLFNALPLVVKVSSKDIYVWMRARSKGDG